MPTLDESTKAPVVSDERIPPSQFMSEEEFVAWCDEDTHAEWVDGEVIMMAPVSNEHSDLGGWLYSLVRLFAENRDLGQVRGPELMVRFGKQRRRRMPDVVFVAKSRVQIIKRNHIEGPPDLIMEVVSPDSVSRDWRDKYLDYQTAGVREYWVIDPMSRHVEAYALVEGSIYRRIDEKDDRITSAVLPGFFMRPAWLWPDTRPKIATALQELGVRF